MDPEETHAQDNPRSIYVAARSCREGLKLCRDIPALMHGGWAENRLLDFNLWASDVGAFTVPPSGLDHRLGDQPDFRAVMLGLLTTLRNLIHTCEQLDLTGHMDEEPFDTEVIQKELALLRDDKSSTHGMDPFAPWSDESSVSSEEGDTQGSSMRTKAVVIRQFKINVDSILDQIIRLRMLIRTSGTATRFREADAYFGFMDCENLQKPDQEASRKLPTEELQTLRTHLLKYIFKTPPSIDDDALATLMLGTESRLQHLERDHRKVLDRLIYANLRRRNRFWYAQKHSGKLAATEAVLFPEEPNPLFAEAEIQNQHGLPTVHNASVDAQMEDTTKTITVASNDQIDPRDLEYPTFSHPGQYQTGLAKSCLPDPPESSKERIYFSCPYCNLILDSTKAEPDLWKRHLSSDVQPYTCVFADCTMESTMFATRDTWRAHLKSEHRTPTYWQCQACGENEDTYVFNSKETFLDHISTVHEDIDLQDDALLEICERTSAAPVKQCPLCIEQPLETIMDADALLEHIGNHMLDFALESLPSMGIDDVKDLSGVRIETFGKLNERGERLKRDVQSLEQATPSPRSGERVQRAVASLSPLQSLNTETVSRQKQAIEPGSEPGPCIAVLEEKEETSLSIKSSNKYPEAAGEAIEQSRMVPSTEHLSSSNSNLTPVQKANFWNGSAPGSGPGKSGSNYYFRIDEVRESPKAPATNAGVAASWIPPVSRGENIRVSEGVCGTWWSFNGQSISAIAGLPQDAVQYKTHSVFYRGGFGFWVMQGDAVASPGDSTWQPLQFDHDSDWSSYLCNAAEHRTVACRRADQRWLAMLLPDIYYSSTVVTQHRGYGKLKGDLPIFLALIAFAMEPTQMRAYLPSMFTNGRWNVYNMSNGRRERRGVVVHVYRSSTTTKETMEHYEQAGYFD